MSVTGGKFHWKWSSYQVWKINHLHNFFNMFQGQISQRRRVGFLNEFLPFRYFSNFLGSSKHTLAVKYHVYIWQVSPQLICCDICQIWKWFKESNRYFCKMENFAYGEINELSNPHHRRIIPRCLHIYNWRYCLHALPKAANQRLHTRVTNLINENTNLGQIKQMS